MCSKTLIRGVLRTARTKAVSTERPVASPSGMEDTCFRMSSFQASGEGSGGGLVERDAEADEVADAGRAFCA